VYTLAVTYGGNDTITLTASAPGFTSQSLDISPGNGNAGTKTLNFLLDPAAPANTAPTATSQSVSTAEDAQQTITLASSDAQNQSQTFAIVTPPAHGSLGPISTATCSGTGPRNCTATVTYSPAGSYNGPDSFTFKSNDGSLDSANATVTITVTAVNDVPVPTTDT
jgi:hypothetical protein